jgi:hypothetical protein
MYIVLVLYSKQCLDVNPFSALIPPIILLIEPFACNNLNRGRRKEGSGRRLAVDLLGLQLNSLTHSLITHSSLAYSLFFPIASLLHCLTIVLHCCEE